SWHRFMITDSIRKVNPRCLPSQARPPLCTCSAMKETIPNPPPLFRKGWLAPLSSTRRRGGGLRLPRRVVAG
ncbi:MAG: hypothetical protein MUO33_04020, partial [Sedimentisphaerales bacterium]|nr:hypothetical protein [Sedimentisphaerales bacterium]